MLCGRCGYDNLDDARYCVICGNESTEAPGEAPVDAGTTPCPSCGFLNEEIAAYCRSCGKKMKKRARRKVAKKPVPDTPQPATAEESPLSLEPSVQDAELAVLFGLDASDAEGTAPVVEAETEAAPKPDEESEPQTTPPADDGRLVTNPEEMARLVALIESETPAPATGETAAELPPVEPAEPTIEAAEIAEAIPEPEAATPSDGGGMITDPDEMAKLIASIKSEEPTAEPPAEEPAEPVTEAAEIAEEVPETPIPEPEAATPSDGGGMIADPDEMAKLIASIKSEEPAPLESAEPVAEPPETAEDVPVAEVPADADAFSTYVSTPHESVEAVLADEAGEGAEDATDEGGDDAEAASIAMMAEVTSTLNSLIKDLLDVEIEEGDGADIVDMPLSVFPPPNPGQHAQPAAEPASQPSAPRLRALSQLPIGLWFRDAVGYFVLVAAFLLSGLSIGLWVWYLFAS